MPRTKNTIFAVLHRIMCSKAKPTETSQEGASTPPCDKFVVPPRKRGDLVKVAQKMLWVLFTFFYINLMDATALANQHDTSEDDLSQNEIKTVLDSDPYISARAAGMGGALSTLADGVHAPFYNPAGIGGLHWEKTKPPIIRQFHFPYLGAGANENAVSLNKEFKKTDGSAEKTVGQSIIDAYSGKRQYARASGMFSFVLSRFTILQSSDIQFAAFRKSENNQTPLTPEESTINAKYRSNSSTGAGLSVTDPKGTFYLGVFSAYSQRKVFSGDFSYDQLVRREDRQADISTKMKHYSGVSTNVGMLWLLGQYGRPSLAVVSKNVGKSFYHLKNIDADTAAEDKTIVENDDLTIGFSVSPHIGKSGAFNFIVEGHHLTDKEVSLNKKFRTAMEFNFGGFGSEATLGIRTGYNLAGISGGLNLNLDLIQFEIASQAEDIGIGNRHVVERRNVGVFSVNVLYE